LFIKKLDRKHFGILEYFLPSLEKRHGTLQRVSICLINRNKKRNKHTKHITDMINTKQNINTRKVRVFKLRTFVRSQF